MIKENDMISCKVCFVGIWRVNDIPSAFYFNESGAWKYKGIQDYVFVAFGFLQEVAILKFFNGLIKPDFWVAGVMVN